MRLPSQAQGAMDQTTDQGLGTKLHKAQRYAMATQSHVYIISMLNDA